MPVTEKSKRNLRGGGKKRKAYEVQKVDPLDLPSYEVLNMSHRDVMFCHEYLMDYNATAAYMRAGYRYTTPESARANACTLLKRANVQTYVKALQENMEQTSGVTRLRVIKELERMAFTSMAHFRNNSWLTVKEFDQLTEEQKACIAEVTTEVKTVKQERDEEEGVTTTMAVEYVKIKLYDKQKALDMLNKMLGFDAPIKIASTVNADRKTVADLFPPLPPPEK